MADTTPKVLEGVFAISKPPHVSSAQVLRDLQQMFVVSTTFSPLLEDTRRKEAEQGHQSKRRRRGNDAPFKMGHGGTLDPLATGVLIVGIGRGTKTLQSFLACTKTYDTTVLFGKSTDTYDIAGKVVGDAEYKHITRELVESQLAKFRGSIKQVPPVFSALKINGMKAYEYARKGKDLPRELESREMHVEECTLLEWFEGGQHDFRWPAEEAPEEEKRAVSKLMGTADASTTSANAPSSLPEGDQQTQFTPSAQSAPVPNLEEPTPDSKASPHSNDVSGASVKATKHTHDHTLNLCDSPATSPAARVRLTVSSGFYVRSFAHDLGLACSSHGIMASLLRARQAIYTVADPPEDPGNVTTLTYADLKAGESVWGPKISAQLERWMDENPVKEQSHVDGRDPATKRRIADEDAAKPRQRFRGDWVGSSKADRKQQAPKWKGKWNQGGKRERMHESMADGQPDKRQREGNTSSPEQN